MKEYQWLLEKDALEKRRPQNTPLIKKAEEEQIRFLPPPLSLYQRF